MIAGLEEITDGHAAHRRPGRQRRRPQGSRHRDGLPELRALSAHDRPREPRVRAQAAQGPEGRDRASGSRKPPRSLELGKLLDRKPKELSGGQRQRVALGRAIVREPAVFLMDEPLSNLDAKLRVQTRAEIARLHQRLQTTIVYVTHDQVEAMTMGTRIAVMSEGVSSRSARPQALYDTPVNLFVAGFIGSPSMNFVDVDRRRARRRLDARGRRLDVAAAARRRRRRSVDDRPELVAASARSTSTSGRPATAPASIQVKADVVEYLGNEELLHVTIGRRSSSRSSARSIASGPATS